MDTKKTNLEMKDTSRFSSFWKVTGLAPDLVCYKFLMKYSKERLDLEKDEELHLEAVAAQIGISCKGVLKRLEEGLARLKRRDEKLAQQLKQYLRDRRALPPDAQKHENEQSEALERESQGSRRRWAEW